MHLPVCRKEVLCALVLIGYMSSQRRSFFQVAVYTNPICIPYQVPSSVLPLNRNNIYKTRIIMAEEIAEEAEEEWRF